MPTVKATFTADISQFRQSLAAASTAVTAFDRSVGQVNSDLKRFGNEFSGANVQRRAETMARAIADIGGATRLTDAELRKASSTIDEALSKYQRLGTQAPAALRTLQQELKSLQTEGAKVATSLNGIGAKSGGFGAFLAGAAGGASVLALSAISSGLRDIIAEGTRLTPLSQSFERLQGGAVNAERSLLNLRVATRGLVSDADLLQASNKGSLLGLDAMGIQFDEVARVATVLGRAMGQDAAKSVDDLTTALSRMSPQILDNLGIKVDLTKATEDYARSIGKSVTALTEEERKLAFATAAMDAARDKAESLGAVELTVAENASRIGVALGDMAAQMLSAGNSSTTLAGALGEVADMLAKIRGAGVGTSLRVVVSEAAGALQSAIKPYLSPFNIGGALLSGAAGVVRSQAGVTQQDILSVMTGRPQRTGLMGAGAPPSGGAGGGTGGGGSRGAAVVASERGLVNILLDAGRTWLSSAKLNYDASRAFTKTIAVWASPDAGIRGSALTRAITGGLTAPGPGVSFNDGIGGFAGGIPAGASRFNNSIASVAVDLQQGLPPLRNWRTELRSVVQSFAQLAQIAGPSLDHVTRGFGTVLASADAAQQMTLSLASTFQGLGDGKGGLSTAGKGVAGGLAGLTTGLSLGSLFTNRAGGAIAGAAGGAVSGAMAGGPAGAVAGGIIGGFSGLFAANQNRKAQREAVEQMRQQTIASFGTVDDFRAAVERAGYSYDYFLKAFNSDKPKTFTKAVNELNAALAEQKKRADTLVKGLSEVARVQGVLSQQQIAQIRNLRPGDPGVEEAVAFMEGQRNQAEQGLVRAVAALESYGANALQDFGQAAQGAAAGLYVAFTEALAQGEAAIDVLARLGGSIDTLSGLGVTGAGFNALKAQQAIVSGPQTGPAASLAQGLGQALSGFANTGLLSPELFGELANGIGEAYKAIENLGQGGLDAARLFQPYLQSIDKLLRDNPALEAQLDDQTRALLDFSRQAGIIGPKFDSSADKIVTALDRIVASLDQFIARMSQAMGMTLPTPEVPGQAAPSAPGDTGTPSDSGANGGDYTTPLAVGGIVTRPTRALIGEAGPEAVIPLNRLWSGTSRTTQTITVNLDGRVLARSVAKGLPSTVAVYGAA